MSERGPGQPTKLTALLKMQMLEYALGGYEAHGHVIPSIQGFSYTHDVSAAALHKWRSEQRDAEYVEIYERLLNGQFIQLTNNGLRGKFNPSLTGLMLGKHGYTNRQDHTSSDGSMTPQVTEIRRTIVKPDK